jgi:hypothetical protein
MDETELANRLAEREREAWLPRDLRGSDGGGRGDMTFS